jgi:hypothetical protein
VDYANIYVVKFGSLASEYIKNSLRKAFTGSRVLMSLQGDELHNGG